MIIALSGCNWTWTHNHLVHKRTLNHLAKLAKWLSCVVSTYLYGAFDCMFLSCHEHVSEWIHTVYLPECHGTPCSKQARNLKFKWLQLDSNIHYSIHSKLGIFPLFWIHTWKNIIQVNERLTKVKEKRSPIQFDVFVLSFSSLQCPRH